MTNDSTLKQKTYSNQSVVRTYFKFNFKYLIKRKSTWLSPLIFFLLLGIGIIVMRIINGPTTNIVAFQTLMAVFSVVFFAILGIVKGVNLFREPTTEGVEILIVSKPLERWQILVVKFSVFNFYGFFLFVLNSLLFIIFSAIMGINADQYLIAGLGIPLGNWFSYLFFGTVSVLLSIKFSSKLVMGLGITLAIFSNIFATSFNLIVGAFLTNKVSFFNEAISKDNNLSKYNNPGPGLVFSGTQGGQEPKFFLSQNGFFGSSFGIYGNTQRNINLKELYDQQATNELVNIWNQGKDSWWVGQLFTFINPTAAFGKISSLGNFGKLSNTIFGRSSILNENDFSWSTQINDNFSTWNDTNGTNYSLVGVDLSNPFNFRDDFGVWTPTKKTIENLGTISTDFGSASFAKGFSRSRSIDTAELTYELINDKRNTLENLIDNELANVTSASEAINKIQNALNSDFDQTFFDKFRNDWDYIDMANSNPNQSLIPGTTWTLDRAKQAEFVYYLAQIVAVNDAFNDQNVSLDTTNKFRLEAQKAQNLDQADSEKQFRFFNESFNTRIIQSSRLKMIELVPTERTPIWALIFLWFSIIILFSSLTIFLYFRKDFQ